MSFVHIGDWAWNLYPVADRHCRDLYIDPDCDCDCFTSYQKRRIHLFNTVGLRTTDVENKTLINHHVRCSCKGCKVSSIKVLKHYRAVKPATREATTPPPKRRKSLKRHPPAPVPAPPSPLMTPMTESTDSSLSVPTTPQQSIAAADTLLSSVPESSNAMETEPVVPQGNHSTDCNCMDCLTELLREASSIAASIPASQTKKPLPKFRLSQTDSSISYASVAAMAAKPGMQLTARPSRKGDLIIIPRDFYTARSLQEEPSLTLLDPAFIRRKAVITRYPITMSISIATLCSNIDSAVRCMSKDDVPVKRLIATFIGPVPFSMDLGVWGTFPIEKYTLEPLKCYRCQRFGHQKEKCKGPIICGVCSQRHCTEVCIKDHKEGKQTKPKCPNCSRPHHAWNRRCPERLRRIHMRKNTSSPKQPKPPTVQRPKDQRPPRQRRQRQPPTATVPVPATQSQPAPLPQPTSFNPPQTLTQQVVSTVCP
ncbi:uncharacterized protein [Palaemon carinicauda]|uniref:uncharacterized protein n=1 Tax=Palaemon carinicauda TaxID=392227 RepID=UPI0035B58AD7